MIALLAGLAFAAFAWNGKRLARALAGPNGIDAQVAEGWSQASSQPLTLTDGTTIFELRPEVVDPHPEELLDPTTGEKKDDYVLQAGTRVVALAKRGPDGTYGRPERGPQLFAAAKVDEVVANATGATVRMRTLALRAGAAGLVLVIAGSLLR